MVCLQLEESQGCEDSEARAKLQCLKQHIGALEAAAAQAKEQAQGTSVPSTSGPALSEVEIAQKLDRYYHSPIAQERHSDDLHSGLKLAEPMP